MTNIQIDIHLVEELAKHDRAAWRRDVVTIVALNIIAAIVIIALASTATPMAIIPVLVVQTVMNLVLAPGGYGRLDRFLTDAIKASKEPNV